MFTWILKIILLFSLQGQANASQVETALVVETVTESTATTDSVKPETAKKDLKESEIPVQLETNKKAAVEGTSAVKFFMSFGIIAVLGAAAFYLIRKYQYKNPKSEATQIKILSQHYLGPKKSLAIVRVAGESVLIGVTDHNISMIKSLSLLDEDIPEDTPKEFETVFAAKIGPVQFSAGPATKIPGVPAAASNDENESKDDFSISGIKDFVSVKLKNMRSLE